MDLSVEVGVITCQGVGLGNGVGVAWRAALVRACSGFNVGVVGVSVTRGVIFGAGVRMLQLDNKMTMKTNQNRPVKAFLPIVLILTRHTLVGFRLIARP